MRGRKRALLCNFLLVGSRSILANMSLRCLWNSSAKTAPGNTIVTTAPRNRLQLWYTCMPTMLLIFQWRLEYSELTNTKSHSLVDQLQLSFDTQNMTQMELCNIVYSFVVEEWPNRHKSHWKYTWRSFYVGRGDAEPPDMKIFRLLNFRYWIQLT